jgi:hypothetical protein
MKEHYSINFEMRPLIRLEYLYRAVQAKSSRDSYFAGVSAQGDRGLCLIA